ncbi:MAG TPA: type II CAAX endopeptidase family protein [Melioribacteraceae bacterium]|nr:type II CAAX endopeptidase family protein [Melioribacteraceae bacterium]
MSLFNLFYNFNEKRLRGYIRVVIVSLLILFSYSISSKIANLISDDFWFTVVDELISCILVCLVIFAASKYLDKRDFKRTLFNINSLWYKQLVIGAVLGFVLIAINFLIFFMFFNVYINFGVKDTNVITFIIKVIVRLIGFFAVALNEEFYVRGYLLTNFSEVIYNKNQKPNFSIYWGLIITSCLFGILHYFNYNATIVSSINLAFIGLLYGYAYVVTGSLALPIGLHLAWNFSQAQIFGLNVSGFSPMVSLLDTKYLSDKIIGGGDFGPEGGLIILISVIIGLFWIYKFSIVNKSQKINNFANIKSSIINFYL